MRHRHCWIATSVTALLGGVFIPFAHAYAAEPHTPMPTAVAARPTLPKIGPLLAKADADIRKGLLRLAPLAKLDKGAGAGVKASDPVAVIRGVLPEGWSVKEVAEGRYPSNRPEGKGKEIILVSKRPPGNAKDKEQLAMVWIMPPDYQDGGHDPTQGQSQKAVPTLIADKHDAKVYLWGHLLGGAPDWPTMERDILKALYP